MSSGSTPWMVAIWRTRGGSSRAHPRTAATWKPTRSAARLPAPIEAASPDTVPTRRRAFEERGRPPNPDASRTCFLSIVALPKGRAKDDKDDHAQDRYEERVAEGPPRAARSRK